MANLGTFVPTAQLFPTILPTRDINHMTWNAVANLKNIASNKEIKFITSQVRGQQFVVSWTQFVGAKIVHLGTKTR